MSRMRDSLSGKLTAMNMLVSGGALLLAAISFFAYEIFTFRANMTTNRTIEAQIIGANSVSPLIFNDPAAAEKTLSALRASKRIVYAAIYTIDGKFFAGYWRDANSKAPLPLPALKAGETNRHWFENSEFSLVQTIMFEGKPAGMVYIRSDLQALYDRFKSYGLILLGIVGASLLAALALSRISQRVISKPILSLAETARFVSREKDFRVRVPATGDQDEVAVLVKAFNEMLMEIQKRDSALQESERQFRSLADSIPQLAWMGEPNGELFWYNHRWYEYTGTTPQQMLGWGWRSVHDPEKLGAVMEKWKHAIETGEPFDMIFPLRGADGTYRDFLTLANPVRDVKGNVARWFGTNTDITEQRRAEEALRQTEKLAATGRLAASIAHEINNPLEAVINLVYLARKQPANAGKYLDLADQELERIAQITRNTLGFYRDSTSTKEVDISEVLGEVIALYWRKIQFKKISVRPDYGNGIKIVGFPGEMRQIFANLVANAIEALPSEGSLVIRASRVTLRDGSNRSGVRVTFLDNGTGIAVKNREKIFEPFYTTKKDVGTGLGLWLTLQLVEKHQGSLRVRSSVEPGRSWTVFSVFLPERPQTV
ncbi:MAG: ATP-binding protein [Candidatus Acidiferrum sp.]